MTSSSPSFVPKFVGLTAALLLLAGCGCSSQEDPSDPIAAAEAGSSAFTAGDYSAAVDHCRRSLELAPGNLDVTILMGRAALAAEDFETAKAAVEQARSLAYDDVAVIQLSAQVALKCRQYDAAFKAYSQLTIDKRLKDRPDLRAIGWTGRGLVGLARCKEDHGRDECGDQAHTDFLQAIWIDPNGAKSAYYHLGILYADVFRYRQAAIDQLGAYIYRMRGTNDRHVAQAEELKASLEQANRDERKSRTGMEQRRQADCAAALAEGDKANRKSQFKTAIVHYEKAVKFDPQSVPAAERLAQCCEAADSRTTAGLQKAYAARRRAVELNASPANLIAAGHLALKLGNRVSAVEFYGRAVASSPRNVAAVDGLIAALKACKRTRSASAYQFYRDSLTVGK